jgi:hypothetical protein
MQAILKKAAIPIPRVIAIIFFVGTLVWFGYSAYNVYELVMTTYSQIDWDFSMHDSPYTLSIAVFSGVNILSLLGFLISTRTTLFSSIRLRKFYFLMSWLAVTVSYLWLLVQNTIDKLLPYIYDVITYVNVEDSVMMDAIMPKDTTAYFLILAFPAGITFIMFMIGISAYQAYRDDLDLAFENFKWTGRVLEVFSNLENSSRLPDIKLGRNSETKEYVVQPGKDRTLNNLIVGSIGTGKTAALALPILNQDFNHMARFINQYPKLKERDDYDSQDVKGTYLNGVSVIEPSNDLCQKAYKLAKAHGIPEEAIMYINPLDKDTPSINPMKGPVETVAESMAQVVEGLNEAGDSGNFFFEQSQRSHLKQYVYLLKTHDPDKEATFDMLLDMYNNAQLVRDMHEKLKATIPKNIELIEDRDEYNYWKIIQQVDEWFDMNLLPRMRNGEPIRVTHGPYRGRNEYYDAKAEFVQGLRNILNDIGNNPLIRRVIFGKSDFDLDVFLEKGGVLLCNTAKGEMQKLSNVLGKFVLLSLQNAVFRRAPEISPYHHILIDEAPDYLYQPFREFPAQSRKYKCILTVICQTTAQMADRYGEHYLTTIVGALRHRMVYGDVPMFDADYFSKTFGDKFSFDESTGEQVVSPLQESPKVRQTNTYRRVEESRLTAANLIFQDAFQCAVKIVANNRPIPVQQIDANFIPKQEFESSKVKVKKKAASLWLEAIQASEEKVAVIENSDVAEKDMRVAQATNKQEDDKEHEDVLSEVRGSQRPYDKPKGKVLSEEPKTLEEDILRGYVEAGIIDPDILKDTEPESIIDSSPSEKEVDTHVEADLSVVEKASTVKKTSSVDTQDVFINVEDSPSVSKEKKKEVSEPKHEETYEVSKPSEDVLDSFLSEFKSER